MAFLPAIGAAFASMAPALQVAGTVLGAGSSILGGIAASNAASATAQLKDMQAVQAQDQAALKASEVARRTKQTLAASRAGAQQNGFELSGSVGDLLGQAEAQGNMDYLTAIYDGSSRATGLRNEASAARAQGQGAMMGGLIGAGTNLFSGLAKGYQTFGSGTSSSVAVSGTSGGYISPFSRY